MATRMQQRRGTAAQWTSADPILNAAEIGYESDTNKFKIGDGVQINQVTGTISGNFYSKSLFATLTPYILALGE